MSDTPHLTPQQIIDLYAAEFGPGIKEARITERGEGSRKRTSYDIWLRVDRTLLRPAIQKLIAIRFPHFAVIAGNDLGTEVVDELGDPQAAGGAPDGVHDVGCVPDGIPLAGDFEGCVADHVKEDSEPGDGGS